MKRDDTLDKMLAVLPKKAKDFSDWHMNKIRNIFKLVNHEIPIKKVNFSFDRSHYR